MLSSFVNTVVNFAEQFGYFGIFFMMVLESSFVPFPSEVAMIPAGYFASIGKMDFTLAMLAGTLGALIGAIINYALGYFLGKKILLSLINKYGKYFLISEKTYYKSENFFQKHGGITTFTARFIPGIRQFVSLPAGVFKMDLKLFLFLTGLGAGLWNLVLMSIGYLAGQNKELISAYLKEFTIGGIVLVFTIILIYYFLNKRKNENKGIEKV